MSDKSGYEKIQIRSGAFEAIRESSGCVTGSIYSRYWCTLCYFFFFINYYYSYHVYLKNLIGFPENEHYSIPEEQFSYSFIFLNEVSFKFSHT